MSDQKFYMIKNARVSFPDIFEVSNVDGDKGNYGATLLLTKEQHADVIKELNGAIEGIIKTNLKGAKVPAEKRCLKDGNNSTRAEYEGYFTVSARNDNKPIVFKPNSNDKAENMEESKIYSGCYVDAKISLWPQNNKYGKRVNAQLIALRYAGEGEAFSAGHVSEDVAAEGFEVSGESTEEILSDDEDLLAA